MKLAHTIITLAALGIGCSSSQANGPDPGATEDPAPAVKDPAPLCEYPPGPYGLSEGDTFPNLDLPGYKNAAGEWTHVDMCKYYDPDGSRGVYGIYFVVGAQWCPPCNEEADLLAQFYPQQYKDHGGVIISAIIQDAKGNPASQTTVDQWIAKHHIGFDIMADEKGSALPADGSPKLPYNYLINPRNMKVFKIFTGVRPGATTITPLNVLMRNNGGSPGAPSTTPG